MLISVPANQRSARYVRVGGLTLQAQPTTPAVGDFWAFVQEQVFGGAPTGFQLLAAVTGVAALAVWGYKALSRQARRIRKQIEQ